MTDVSFPRMHARSQRFTLGRPRTFTVTDDRVLFLRSAAGDDPVHDLWALDLASGEERRLTDARSLQDGAETLTPEERARRERLREGGSGIVAYSASEDGRRAVFTLAGTVWVVDTDDGGISSLQTAGPAFDPRLSRDGTKVAAVVDGGLHVGAVEGGALSALVVEEGVTWGLAEFIAGEEMQRTRGFWWDPDGDQLLVARVDERAVDVWHIADPANPQTPATEHRYPAAGTRNADVGLWLVAVGDGQRSEVKWDREAYPYLAQVDWSPRGPALVQVQSRDQRTWAVLSVGADADTQLLRHDRDDHWLELVGGSPTWVGGELAVVVDLPNGQSGARAVVVNDRAVTSSDIQVRRIAGVRDGDLWLTFSGEDPTSVHVGRLELASGALEVVAGGPGVHDVAVGDSAAVLVSATLDDPTVTFEVVPHDPDVERSTISNLQMLPSLRPDVELLRLGERDLHAALIRPAGDGPWPVLLLPYAGPHAQRVLRSSSAFLTAQWFADHGFAVLVADGRGTPGRGPAFEREVAGDLAGPPLQDQVDALHAAAAHEPRLDLSRVGISGWSFGGYLAALAVLRRPDVFHAAVAGAPVTQWGLYDTHYTERYLGDPTANADAYARSDLVDGDGQLLGAVEPPDPDRPPRLLIIHGLADDNVVAAHSLRLSAALLAAGRPHEFLPLSGVTHMTPQEVIAENLLLHQLRFLQAALA